MGTRFVANHCGRHYESSDRSPALPMDIGMGQKGPNHGLKASLPAVFGGAALSYSCRKCGLVQERVNRKAKFGGVADKCTRCNRPMFPKQGPETLYFCIKCGRVWNPAYAKTGSGNVMQKCPHCANTKMHLA